LPGKARDVSWRKSALPEQARRLLAELATHQRDIVIAVSPHPANVEVRRFNH
jgi:hypothetical protein